MKLSTLFTSTLLALTATPTLTTAWVCNSDGGPSHSGLRQIQRDFNRVFGEARLTARPGQCYVAICSGLIFGYCNQHGVTTTEVANHRNIVAGTDPIRGGNCKMIAESNHPFHQYMFETTARMGLYAPGYTIRRC